MAKPGDTKSVHTLFAPEGPDHSWNLDQLGAYAKAKKNAILEGERALAPQYWALGKALSVARRQLGRCAWSRQLEIWKISKAMASRARAIFHTFSSPQALAKLTVEEAFAQRQRRQVHVRHGKKPKGIANKQVVLAEEESDTPRDDVAAVAAFLANVRDEADRLIDVAAFAERNERIALLPAYKAALERLQFLGRMMGADDKQPRSVNKKKIVRHDDPVERKRRSHLPRTSSAPHIDGNSRHCKNSRMLDKDAGQRRGLQAVTHRKTA